MKEEYLKKLENIRKEKDIKVGSLDDFKKRYKMNEIKMVKVGKEKHKNLMQLKYKLGLKSASDTIQFLLDFYKKNKSKH